MGHNDIYLARYNRYKLLKLLKLKICKLKEKGKKRKRVVGGWIDVQAIFRIAYSNKKCS